MKQKSALDNLASTFKTSAAFGLRMIANGIGAKKARSMDYPEAYTQKVSSMRSALG